MSYIGNTQQNQSYVPAVDFFNGNGSTTAFTLSKPVASVAAIQVVVSNVSQKPGDAYTVSGSTITFTSAPPSGTNNIYVYYTSPNNYVMEPGQGTVSTNKIADGAVTPAKLSTGYPYWDSSGNVGIGTSSPNEILNLYKASRPYLVMQNATTGTTSSDGFWIGYDSTNLDVQIRNKENANLLFFSNDIERMRINSSGNLIVGGTADIDVSQIALWQPDSKNGISFRSVGIDGKMSNQFYNVAGSRVGYINYGASTTTYATSSDYRLKENIQPMQNALGVVAQLNPVTYNWKADGSDGQGFIAHELQAVVPDCVTGEKDAVDAEGNPVYQGIDTSFLVATLCKAIQELEARVKALEAK